jgi:hypothetical protein
LFSGRWIFSSGMGLALSNFGAQSSKRIAMISPYGSSANQRRQR